MFDPLAADRPIRFIELLRTSTGRPFKLIDWQKQWIRLLFGTLMEDGQRQYRESICWVGRQNGKTELCGALMLYLLCTQKQKNAQYYSIASDREQAGILFRVMKNIIEQTPDLAEICKVTPGNKRIVFRPNGSFYQSLCADSWRQLGTAPSGVIYDEIGVQRNGDLYDALFTGQVSRPNALLLGISTAGASRTSFGYRIWERSLRQIQFPANDPRFLAQIYAVDAETSDDDCLNSEAVWRKANPSYGITIQASDFSALVSRAKAEPSFLSAFKRFHLNIWTDADQKWINMSNWLTNAKPVDPAALRGKVCYAGVDLSRTDDTSAVVLVFPMGGDEYHVLPFIYAPDETIARREREGVPYRQWNKAGHLRLCTGKVISYDQILGDIKSLRKDFNIAEIHIDPFNAHQFAEELKKMGCVLVPFQQGFLSYNAPCKEFERAIMTGKLCHGGHPVLAWQASNAVAVMDAAENIKPDRERSTDKIDGIAATIMGLRGAMANAQVNCRPAKTFKVEMI